MSVGWSIARSRRASASELASSGIERWPPAAEARILGSSTVTRGMSVAHECLHAENAGQPARQWLPGVAAVRARIHGAGGRADIHAAGLEMIDGHRAAQHAHVRLVRQASSHLVPRTAAIAAAMNAESAPHRHAVLVALERERVEGPARVIDDEGKAEPRGQPLLDTFPAI